MIVPCNLRFLAACLASAAASAPASGGEVAVDLSRRAQTIRGFGTAVDGNTDAPSAELRSAGRSLMNTEAFYDAYVKDFGGSAVRFGLSKTALSETKSFNPWHDELDHRIPLGADTYENIKLFNFDTKGVGNVGRFVQEAQRRGDPMTTMAAIWSPPHWMKGPEVDLGWRDYAGQKPKFNYWNQSAHGSLNDDPDNLVQFGRYVAAYAKGFERAFDAPIDVLSVQNEPRFSLPYDSAAYTPELFQKAVGAIRFAFDEHNAANPNDLIVTQLMGPDDLGMGGDGWNLAKQAFNFIDRVRHDGDRATAVDSYGMHGWNGGGQFAGSDDRIDTWRSFRDGEVWDTGRVLYEGVGDGPDLWVTEHSGHHFDRWVDPSSKFNGSLGLALEIHEALVGGDAAGYMYWQFQDYKNSRSSYTLTADLDGQTPKLAAFKHFAKYVRPDMVRVEADTFEGSIADHAAVKVSAFLDEEAGTLTYVLLNVSTEAQEVRLASLAAGGELLKAAWSADGAYHRAGTASADGWITLQGESVWSVVTSLGSLAAVQVPEPASGLALLAGGVLLLRRRGARAQPRGPRARGRKSGRGPRIGPVPSPAFAGRREAF